MVRDEEGVDGTKCHLSATAPCDTAALAETLLRTQSPSVAVALIEKLGGTVRHETKRGSALC